MNRSFPFSSDSPSAPQKVESELKPNDPLLEAYNALDAAWRQAEEEFAAMQIPVTVSHEVSQLLDPENNCGGSETFWLEWTRYQHQWRICYVRRTQDWGATSCDEKKKPIAECATEIRVQLASELSPLREKMKQEKSNYQARIVEAIETIKEALAD